MVGKIIRGVKAKNGKKCFINFLTTKGNKVYE